MTSDFDPAAPEVNHSSPGKILRDAREQLGLTQDQVAKELYMTLAKVKAIESDQFNRLHSDTFIRGYLRTYAQLVKVDSNELMSIYDSQAKILGLKEVFVPTKQETSTKKFWQSVGILAGVLLLMWLVSVWFLDNRKQDDYSNINIALPEKIDTELEIPLNPVESGFNPQGSAPSDSTPSDSVAAQVSDNKSIINQTSAQDRLEFYFRDECWVEVSDANGDVLATELQLKDSKLILTGRSPFDVKLGNAPAVSLKLNDEIISLVPTLGTNVLALKVGSRLGN
jgi:cytoskeleton protein RodZ